MNEPGFQPNAFQSDAFQVEYDEVSFSLAEGADLAAFTVTSTTLLSFALTEGADLAAFNTTAKTLVTFALTEGADLAAFDATSTTFLSFALLEGKDLFAGEVLTGAMLEFDLFEGPDVPVFRTFATWWDRGDAYYMYVPYESQTITLTTDVASYILVPTEDRNTYLQNEWRRIDVDQERPRRRETT